MTNKEASATLVVFQEDILNNLWLSNEQRKGLAEAIDLAIKTLEREADLEQAVVNIKMSEEESKQFKQMLQEHTPLYTITSDTFVEGASTERPQGEWIMDNEHTKNPLLWYKCNLCGVYHSPTNFCPNCGADMRKGGAI